MQRTGISIRLSLKERVIEKIDYKTTNDGSKTKRIPRSPPWDSFCLLLLCLLPKAVAALHGYRSVVFSMFF